MGILRVVFKMVVVTVLGLGRLGGNIAGDLAFNGHTVRAWDNDKNALDKLHERLAYEKKRLKEDKLLPQFLGDVFCFTNLDEALFETNIVVEAINEELEDKRQLLERVSKQCKPNVIIATSSLRIPLEEIFENSVFKERCIGLRFLYPVYCVPEVEITKSNYTSLETVETCLNFLERCGKTGFFRSGPQPLILNEDQRSARRAFRADQFKKNRIISSRATNSIIPYLAHNGNFAPIQDDASAKRPECWMLNAECVICMDRQRACILAPCHHLCTCSSCGELLVNRKDSCPICRRSITHTVPFYFS